MTATVSVIALGWPLNAQARSTTDRERLSMRTGSPEDGRTVVLRVRTVTKWRTAKPRGYEVAITAVHVNGRSLLAADNRGCVAYVYGEGMAVRFHSTVPGRTFAIRAVNSDRATKQLTVRFHFFRRAADRDCDHGRFAGS